MVESDGDGRNSSSGRLLHVNTHVNTHAQPLSHRHRHRHFPSAVKLVNFISILFFLPNSYLAVFLSFCPSPSALRRVLEVHRNLVNEILLWPLFLPLTLIGTAQFLFLSFFFFVFFFLVFRLFRHL